METRANYILIGAFTVAGFLGLLAFFLWFAQVEMDRQHAYYDVRFTSVSGLSRAADVRFGGLPVGQVVDVRLAPEKDGTILVRLEVAMNTPVRADSRASIEAQGVTGVSFVGIDAGTPEAPLLQYVPGEPPPEIQAGRSVLQTLTEDAPELLEQFVEAMGRVNTLLSEANKERVENILTNVESASGEFAQALSDFTVVAASVSGFAIEVSRFNEILEQISTSADQLLVTANDTVERFGALAIEAKDTLETGNRTLDTATGAIDDIRGFLAADLRDTVAEVKAGVGDLRREVETLGAEARGMIAGFAATGTEATARLAQIEATIAAADTMLARATETLTSVDAAAARIDALVAGDGAALVADARAVLADARRAVASVTQATDTDLPALVADIRAATGTARQTIETVGRDLTSASGRIGTLADQAGGAIDSVTETFGNANATLAAINEALETGQSALSAAERAFEGADRVINSEAAAIAADLRAAIARLDAAIAQVSDDLPAVTADLRAASEAASAAFAEVGRVAQGAGPAVRAFAADGLPQYARLATETRGLIRNLDRLVAQLQRDPARLLLGRQTPEFRR
ncbi:MAG: MlaD family protein [Gemmobacter sp.]